IQNAFHNKPIVFGDMLEIMHEEPGRLWLYPLDGEVVSLGALLSIPATSSKTVRFTITEQGFQLQNQTFTHIGVGGLDLDDPSRQLYGYISLDTEAKRLLVENVHYGPIHVYFTGKPYFSMTFLKAPTIRLGIGKYNRTTAC
ncbi:hypothetical protein ACT4UT_33720, partial [Bacillus sp. B-TM1]